MLDCAYQNLQCMTVGGCHTRHTCSLLWTGSAAQWHSNRQQGPWEMLPGEAAVTGPPEHGLPSPLLQSWCNWLAFDLLHSLTLSLSLACQQDPFMLMAQRWIAYITENKCTSLMQITVHLLGGLTDIFHNTPGMKDKLCACLIQCRLCAKRVFIN